MLRLTINIGMHMHANSVGVMGPDCSSWGLPARGSSMRSPININGYVLSDWVRRSSVMVTRFLCLKLSAIPFGFIESMALPMLTLRTITPILTVCPYSGSFAFPILIRFDE